MTSSIRYMILVHHLLGAASAGVHAVTGGLRIRAPAGLWFAAPQEYARKKTKRSGTWTMKRCQNERGKGYEQTTNKERKKKKV